jgi:hypothetical protein
VDRDLEELRSPLAMRMQYQGSYGLSKTRIRGTAEIGNRNTGDMNIGYMNS